MNFEELTPVLMCCNNCGHKCIGYRARDETVRFECERCSLKMVSKKISNRVADVRITAPVGQSLF